MLEEVTFGLGGYETISVLTGATAREDIEKCPYRPHLVVESVAELIPTSNPKKTHSSPQHQT